MKNVPFSNDITVYEVDNTEEHRSARNEFRELRDRQRFHRKIDILEPILKHELEIRITKSYAYNL